MLIKKIHEHLVYDWIVDLFSGVILDKNAMLGTIIRVDGYEARRNPCLLTVLKFAQFHARK
jgi:hypothetical protein